MRYESIEDLPTVWRVNPPEAAQQVYKDAFNRAWAERRDERAARARLERRASKLPPRRHRALGSYAAALTNARSFSASSAPLVRTPLQTSSANGCTAAMASRTFAAFKPPARNSGTSTPARICALSVQSCTRPVPPSSLTAAD